MYVYEKWYLIDYIMYDNELCKPDIHETENLTTKSLHFDYNQLSFKLFYYSAQVSK